MFPVIFIKKFCKGSKLGIVPRYRGVSEIGGLNLSSALQSLLCVCGAQASACAS